MDWAILGIVLALAVLSIPVLWIVVLMRGASVTQLER